MKIFHLMTMLLRDESIWEEVLPVNTYQDTSKLIFTGSLFTATLLSSPSNMLKKFITTFSKRVAQSAKPEACQECECHSDENGVPYVECISCDYPTPVYFDFVSFISFS